MRRLVAIALASLAGCHSTDVAPLTATLVEAPKDEREILAQVRQQEAILLSSDLRLNSAPLEAYLNAILTRLHPARLPDDFRLRAHVIADPSFNAFVLPNGAMFIHTGLLSSLENEAQLAAILGHELSHAVQRHGLRSYRSMKNHSAFAASMYIAGGGSVYTTLTSLGALSSAMGYSRDLEREADGKGFQMLVTAGYAPRQAAQVFRLLMQETDPKQRQAPFFFSSHPRLSERSAVYRELTDALPPERRESGFIGEGEYEAMLPSVLHANAHAALQKGDMDRAEKSAQRALRLRSDDPHGRYWLGEVHRRRPAASDREAALSHYRAAIALDPQLAEAHRGLGLQLMKSGDSPAAALALRRYLELAPDAGDKAHILQLIRQCEEQL